MTQIILAIVGTLMYTAAFSVSFYALGMIKGISLCIGVAIECMDEEKQEDDQQ